MFSGLKYLLVQLYFGMSHSHDFWVKPHVSCFTPPLLGENLPFLDGRFLPRPDAVSRVAARTDPAAQAGPRAWTLEPRVRRFPNTWKLLVGGLVAVFYFPTYWVANHHNWLIFFRGVAQPPTRFLFLVFYFVFGCYMKNIGIWLDLTWIMCIYVMLYGHPA